MWGDMKRSSQLHSLSYLVVADTADVTSSSTYQSVKSTGLDSWQLQADPGKCLFSLSGCSSMNSIRLVIPHCFHVFGHKGGVSGAFTVTSKWLKNAISGANNPNDSADMIPLLSNIHATSSTLAGFNTVCDPILGHILAFRTTNSSTNKSSFGIMNISAHIHLYELEAASKLMIERHVGENGGWESKSTDILDDRRTIALDKIYQSGISKLRDAISKIPSPESDYITDLVSPL